MDVRKKVSEIMSKRVNVSNLKEDDSLSSLGLDSLDLVELIMGIEEEFNIEIPDGEAEKVVTVGDVVEYIKENVG